MILLGSRVMDPVVITVASWRCCWASLPSHWSLFYAWSHLWNISLLVWTLGLWKSLNLIRKLDCCPLYISSRIERDTSVHLIKNSRCYSSSISSKCNSTISRSVWTRDLTFCTMKFSWAFSIQNSVSTLAKTKPCSTKTTGRWSLAVSRITWNT